MNCLTFEENLSDYLEGVLASPLRAECAAHRLVCLSCRTLYADVRTTLAEVGMAARADVTTRETAQALTSRVLAATTTGEMLSCADFDQLIERYFEGALRVPELQTFETHFSSCHKCRRLLCGIDEAIELCREAKEATEFAVPATLHQRIMTATSGSSSSSSGSGSVSPEGRKSVREWMLALTGLVFSPQWATAALIVWATSFAFPQRTERVEARVEQVAQQVNDEAEEVLLTLGQESRQQLQQATFRFASAVGFFPLVTRKRTNELPPLSVRPMTLFPPQVQPAHVRVGSGVPGLQETRQAPLKNNAQPCAGNVY